MGVIQCADKNVGKKFFSGILFEKTFIRSFPNLTPS